MFLRIHILRKVCHIVVILVLLVWFAETSRGDDGKWNERDQKNAAFQDQRAVGGFVVSLITSLMSATMAFLAIFNTVLLFVADKRKLRSRWGIVLLIAWVVGTTSFVGSLMAGGNGVTEVSKQVLEVNSGNFDIKKGNVYFQLQAELGLVGIFAMLVAAVIAVWSPRKDEPNGAATPVPAGPGACAAPVPSGPSISGPAPVLGPGHVPTGSLQAG